jgi:hypothetical protein
MNLVPALSAAATLLTTLAIATPGFASQDAGAPDLKVVEGLYPGQTYSPYAQRSFPSRVYWGETHLHTGLSLALRAW